jgi:hypothetical protein
VVPGGRLPFVVGERVAEPVEDIDDCDPLFVAVGYDLRPPLLRWVRYAPEHAATQRIEDGLPTTGRVASMLYVAVRHYCP